MNFDERLALRHAVSDARRAAVDVAHGRAQGVGLRRQHDPTDREIEVIRLLAAGVSQPEIAAALHLAKGTVKAHVSNVMGKLGARNATQACVVALRDGWIE